MIYLINETEVFMKERIAVKIQINNKKTKIKA